MKSLQNISYKTLFTILFFSLAGIIFFLRIGKPAKKVSAAWWDEMWHYRKAISIENTSGSDLTDFQVAISIGTSQLITEGKMQTDCDDIRITDINGNLLPHWIEENNPGCNQLTDTKIWLKANSLPTSGATIYIYYGNQQANNSENGNNVFEFFDDFKNNLNKWINVSNSNWSITDGILNITPPSNNNYIVANKSIGVSGLIIESQIKSASGSNHPGLIWHANTLTSSSHRNDHIYLRPHAYNTSTNIQPAYFNGSLGTFSNTTGLFNSDVWHNIKIEIPSSNSIKYYRNDINEANFTNQQYQSNTYTGIAAHAGTNMQFDNFRVRKYTSTNPTPFIQSEELSPVPIAYWKFDEGSGTNSYDSTGINNGTIYGTTWQNEDQCISGKCLYFNGTSSDYVSIPNSKSLQIINNQTISMWLKPTAFGARRNPINKAYGGEGTITLETNGIMNYYWGTAGLNSSPYQGFGSSTLTLNVWNHITLVRDITNNKLTWYINGKQTNQTTPAYSQATASTYDLIIGKGYAGNFIGYIDEVKLYPYARTADQIKQDYNSRGSLSGAGVNLGVQSNTSPNIKSSLVSYWKMDENNGTTIYDTSGNNNNGTFGTGDSSATWTQGKINTALNFDGSNDFVSIPNSSGDLNNDFTISLWVNPNDDPTNPRWLSLIDNSSNNLQIGHMGDSEKVYFRFANSTIETTTGISLNQWTHVTCSMENGERKIFFNGIEQSTEIGGITANGTYSAIGGGYTTYFGNGLIDEVKIYNRALTAEEVKQDYNQGSVVQFGSTNQTIGSTTTSLEYCIPGDTSYCAPPVGEWNFEENTGNTAKDTSGNNLNGSIAGNSVWASQCHKGACLTLDHVDDRVTINHSSLLEPQSITIQGWIKLNSTGDRQILFTKWYGYSFEINSSGYPYFRLNGSSPSDLYSSKSITWGKWHHIAATLDNETKQKNIYLDGINVGSTITTGSIVYNQGILAFPYSNSSYGYGLIDDFKIYNYARTPAQIAYDYNRGAPIGHWKLDECQGAITFDSSGLGNTGAIIIGTNGSQNSLGTCAIGTSAAWTNGSNGKTNSSLNFDGVDDHIDIPNSTTLDLTTQLTISIWVHPTNFNRQTAIERTNSGATGGSYSLYSSGNATTDAGRPEIWFKKSGKWTQVIKANSQILLNKWSHLVTTYDGSNTKLFINGFLDKNEPFTGPLDSSVSNLAIGYSPWNNGNHFNGQIDDVRIYNYALTPEQVKTVYNNGAINFN